MVWATLISYLLGSISFSYIMGKLVKGIDIRKYGSGNAGATNTLRVLGKGPAILVLALDIAKGIAAVRIGAMLSGEHDWLPSLCGLLVIVGHNWPVFFGFKGGKGIAAAIGVLATISFLPALYAGIIAILSIVVTRYVSLGSLLFTLLCPVFIAFMGRPQPVLWASLAIALLAVIRHRTNILKLMRGEENKLGKSVGQPTDR
jgi:glycerol-3-phosphate acyltransferase PlsY